MKINLAIIVLFGCVRAPAQVSALTQDIVGPVIPANTSPWPWYDKAEYGNVRDITTAALSETPQLGAPAAGTFSLADGCNITLTGPGASEFGVNDAAIVAWNATDGIGSGRYKFYIGSISGNVMTSLNTCGLPPNIAAQSGLSVYHCSTRCNDDSSARWGVGNVLNDSWNFYDTGLALYRYYLRTGNASDLTTFRNFADIWWSWTINQGGTAVYPPRGVSLVSQFVRALDGHPERFAPLYNMLHDGSLWIMPDGNDNREPGYTMLFEAVGAKADSDPVRHSWYCSQISSEANAWLSTQRPEGYWSEKNSQYAYAIPGASPWRMFSVTQGLARSYDVLQDTTAAGCNNPTLANEILTSLERAADFIYNYGYAPQNRGVFYDVQYPDDGQDATNNGLKSGTVSVNIGSTAVIGSGTTFRATFAPCDGSTWIGIWHPSDGFTWTHRVASCNDDTHLTLATAWGSQCITGAIGTTCATTNASNEQFYQGVNAPTNCGNLASTCWSGAGAGTYQNGDRNNNRDPIWIMGWLYKTTGLMIYKTRGDELFSATYGGPAAGPGYNFPNNPGLCGGPACDGIETDYIAAIHGCGWDPTLPCNDASNYAAGNAYVATGKRFAQGSGIGGADNYLAWRMSAGPPPIISPPAGAYPSAQSVRISATTLGATIRYTTDGSEPSYTTGTVYSGPIAVSATETIKAIVCVPGWTDSAVALASYAITGIVATPTFALAAGAYTSAQSATISTTTSGATIRYTTDGSTPSETNGTVYSGAIAVSATTTIKAIAYENGWADSALASATYTIIWYNAAWSNRKAITISHAQVSGLSNLTNFPVLISLASDADLQAHAQANGNDILFTDSGGATKLNHEIESYNNGKLLVWVQVPSISPTTDTTIYMYYGNSSAQGQQNAMATWDATFSSVWHLEEILTGTGQTIHDSTGHYNAASNWSWVAADQQAGKIGGALYFDGGNPIQAIDYQGSGGGFYPSGSSPRTISTWFNSRGGVGAVFGYAGLSFFVDGQQLWLWDSQANANKTNLGANIALNTWNHLSVTYDGTSITTYLNGVFVKQWPAAAVSGYTPPLWGADFVGNLPGYPVQGWFLGQIDESRISSVARSAGWITAEYNNQNSPNSFYTVGSPQSSSGGVVQASAPAFSPTGGTSTPPITSAAAANPASSGTSWPNGYNYQGVITVSHLQVPNTDQTNFPVLVSGTYSDLALAPNGKVSNPNGYDIVFAAQPDGSQPLAFQRESYAPNGQVTFWVQVPTVSHTTDAVFYVFYGNASVSVDPSTPTAVWDSNYRGVWHFGNGTTLTGNDSTANGVNGMLAGATAVTGEVSGAANLYGNAWIDMGANVAALEPATGLTVESWVKPTNAVQNNYAGFVLQDYINPRGAPYISYKLGLNYLNHGTYEFELSTTSGADTMLDSGVPFAAGTWAHVVGTWDGTTKRIYVNGVLKASAMQSGTISYAPTGRFRFGANSVNTDQIAALVDEGRVSSLARSADWIATEYHNQSSPATFYSAVWGQSHNGGTSGNPTVSGSPAHSSSPALAVGPMSLTYTATAGAGNATSQAVSIGSSNSTTLGTWTATITSGSTFIQIGRSASGPFSTASINGTGNSTIYVLATTSGAGRYSGAVDVSATGATSSPVPVSVSLTVSPASSGATWPNGYNYQGVITVSHLQVPNTDQTNFPLLVSGTYSDLALAPNGKVSNPNGYDIVFAAQPDGSQPLPFQRESYAPNGQVTFWVQVPTMSHTTDTVFYVFYGNASVSVDPSTPTAVWDSNYRGVWHFGNGTTLTGNDSTANGVNGTLAGATAVTGEVSGAANLYGNAWIDMGANVAALEPATGLTVESWVKPTNAVQNNYAGFVLQDYINPRGAPYISYKLGLNYLNHGTYEFELSTTSGADTMLDSGVPFAAGTWAHVVGTWDGTTKRIYVNGVLKASAMQSGTISYAPTGRFRFGANSVNTEQIAALVDEGRVSSLARSADWIATEYHNQSSPATFYSAVWGQNYTGGNIRH